MMPVTSSAIVHSPETDIYLPVLSWFHPFDGRKFSRAWRLVAAAADHSVQPVSHGLSEADIDRAIRAVHDEAYLASLSNSHVVARALGVKALRWLPAAYLDKRILRPMRSEVAATCAAAQRALAAGLVFNFGGGFHHAHADHSEGFCIYNDVAVALQHLRSRGAIAVDSPAWIVDLDAHRGNGNEAIFARDPRVHILDLYNQQAYPGGFEDDVQRERYPHVIGIPAGCSTDDYLARVRARLDAFIAASPAPAIAFYNAGTDIVAGDHVGRQNVSENGVFERDQGVIETLVGRGIPTVILTSGGYSDASHRLIARTALWMLQRFSAGSRT
jgi:histone deacetylase 11